MHNVLQAHAAAVKQFRALVPGGKISINLNCDWAQPLTGAPSDAVTAPLSAMCTTFEQSGLIARDFVPDLCSRRDEKQVQPTHSALLGWSNLV